MTQNTSKKKLKKRRVTFSLAAPDALEVFVAGEFNGWNEKTAPMKRKDGDIWQKTVMLPPGAYEYKFVVDGEWLTDPENTEIRPNGYGTYNSVLVVPAK